MNIFWWILLVLELLGILFITIVVSFQPKIDKLPIDHPCKIWWENHVCATIDPDDENF